MIKGKGMSLTGNQKAFAQYLADLWGKPEALGEMCDLFPVGDASEAGLLHSFRISKQSELEALERAYCLSGSSLVVSFAAGGLSPLLLA